MTNFQSKADILIVDDILPNLRLLTRMLTGQGYKVRGSPNGSTALKAVRLSPPSLILLDIMMPDMDGYEVCRHLKADERTRDIPIIFISAMDDTVDKVRAFTSGGVDYITKPFEVEEVLARVKTHLSIRQLQRQLQQKNNELSETNQQLTETNFALTESNQELDAFGHTVAHDLKNPLSVIQGYASMLRGDEFSPGQSKLFLDRIERTAVTMENIIEELLLLSSVRKNEVVSTPLDMEEIAMAAQYRLANKLVENSAQVTLPSVWPVVLGYAPWIEEVWVNYLSNGIKYGGQSPRLQLGADVQADNRVKFWVQDNGPGLSPEEQAKLFIPFTRVTRLHIEGHGLGLSIVQRIIEKLGGQVGVESEIGQGSRFYFTLPRESQTTD